ncbi:ferrous iron transport protein A [Acinetobacter qingfengensis]|uniref:Iron transporter n=1 Tax=Acinetobacter qingfengensis TaxID=1262585 RepID=A0A1E7QYU6_9GAMM|nr:FeoA family protein [Acinetobacter qingfengensis]KAA8733119.1 ferrous iron transport protein A [Acinetobacter qingfengensis]OEY92268.1 iron transporter [Acinetobacter qingfengensis]
MRLSDLKTKQQATISHVHQLLDGSSSTDNIAKRLRSLGFVTGEHVEVITKGLFGGEPILVKVGLSRFALRRNEAERIEVDI